MLSTGTTTPTRTRRPERRNSARERQCLVSRETIPADQLIRFVVGPDQTVVPDIDGRLPGRGLWVQARRDAVEAACKGGQFAKAARHSVQVETGLADRVEALLTRRCLDLIGLARRSSDAVAGFEKVKSLLESRKSVVLLIANDGGDDGRRKMLSINRRKPVIDLFSSAELGNLFGREKTVYAAVSEGGLATLLVKEASRLAGFRTADAE